MPTHQSLFCDEGGKCQTGAIITFAAICASPSAIDAFNTEWNLLLAAGQLESFHMKELADEYADHGPMFPPNQTVDQRTQAFQPFADAINKHLEIGLMQAWDVKGYAQLPAELKKKLGGNNFDPHYLSMVRGLLEIVDRLPEDDSVHIICDDDVIKAWDTNLHYRAICAAFPEIQKRFAALTFAKDEFFPPLQAADMVAFLSRLHADECFHAKPNKWAKLFDYLAYPPAPMANKMKWFHMFADEVTLADHANSLTKPLGKP
jgi:hypothetical protein